MPVLNGPGYRESVLSADQIEALCQQLEEDFVEVEDYRSEDCRVWVNLDHVEAVAIDHGKLCTWRFPDGTHGHLRETLLKRFA